VNGVEVVLKHRGKWFKVSNEKVLSEDIKCPYCSGILEEDFDYDIIRFRTEDPRTEIPKSLRDSLPDSYSLWKCQRCGRFFAEWEIGDYDAHLFYEVLKLIKVPTLGV